MKKKSIIAETADIKDSATILNSNISDQCYISDNAKICYSQIGMMSSIARDTKIYSSIVGKFCSISWNVSIGPANHDYHKISQHAMLFADRFGMIENFESRYYNQYNKDVIIGNDVWIGCNSVILRGVTIGDGAVIGANSLITKDVAPYTIMGGVNLFLKNRFSKEIVEELLRLRWYDYSLDTIKKNISLLSLKPTLTILEELKKRLEET